MLLHPVNIEASILIKDCNGKELELASFIIYIPHSLQLGRGRTESNEQVLLLGTKKNVTMYSGHYVTITRWYFEGESFFILTDDTQPEASAYSTYEIYNNLCRILNSEDYQILVSYLHVCIVMFMSH
jgi:hypothetical protein